ncbi:hypothetical protein GRJ2_001575900 [Grus japonensis]|uniref:Uncharacterized protein n=1 Tax=Grus japonensis TaxID=30415 RepID=A0ABC9X100_GRUJA
MAPPVLHYNSRRRREGAWRGSDVSARGGAGPCGRGGAAAAHCGQGPGGLRAAQRSAGRYGGPRRGGFQRAYLSSSVLPKCRLILKRLISSKLSVMLLMI